ncbi:ATP-binding cassette domain-containing protein, partial [Mesorhizobium sp. M7A.F.Ca.US.006.01.1.1]|uniref:ATP-binding cassette domain-containing protein n=1 Tax=Mesorhizobium sp. M7A.F.Ca.US.006.01.1.1 TaxID=2496707 RepID=UPI000FCA8C78
MTPSKADQPNTKDGVVLSVRNLHASIPVRGGEVHAVNGVSFDLRKGETLGILGESGSGKSVMLRSIMGILPEYARQEGEIYFQGQNLLDMSRRTAKDIRGPLISMIFQ